MSTGPTRGRSASGSVSTRSRRSAGLPASSPKSECANARAVSSSNCPVGDMLRRTILLSVVVAILPAAAPARDTWRVDVGLAKRGLALAVSAQRLTPDDAARYRGIVYRTEHALPRLGRYRYRDLA